MNWKIDIEEFIRLAEKLPVVDVRSPKEFENGHIPGAVNIPLFIDEERAKVGIAYKKQGRYDAILEGLEIVGPRLASYVRKASAMAVDGSLLVHCWRGGMRSDSIAWLFNTAGLKARTLNGGYKVYRRYARECFEKKFNLIVLSGSTGSGKSEILEKMKSLGEQVIDLEGLASHKGSAFGAIGQKTQPTCEQFENDLFGEWRKLDPQRCVWIEDESRSIGSVFIPEPVFLRMRNTTVIRILVDKETRIKRLVREYAGYDPSLLAEAVKKISKRLGGLNYKLCMEALEVKDFYNVAGHTLDYYDKAYEHGLSKRDADLIHSIDINTGQTDEIAKLIIKFVRENHLI